MNIIPCIFTRRLNEVTVYETKNEIHVNLMFWNAFDDILRRES